MKTAQVNLLSSLFSLEQIFVYPDWIQYHPVQLSYIMPPGPKIKRFL